jgi:DNA replication protein DnaC
MNTTELDRSLRRLRLSGMASVLETRLLEAQASKLSHADFLSKLVEGELERRRDRLLERRTKMARFRDPAKTLESFDFGFNPKMERSIIFELATARFVTQREDVLLLGPPGTGKSHLAQALGQAAICQGHTVIYRECHMLLQDVADATLEGKRKEHLDQLERTALLIIDDLGMRELPRTAAEDLLEVVMRRYERSATMLTSNRPLDDWGKLLGDTAAVSAMLDRLLHHSHVIKCGPSSWRLKQRAGLQPAS